MNAKSFIQRMVALSCLVASSSWAAEDRFGLGNGRSGSLVAGSAVVVNAYAPLTANASVGDTTLNTGATRGARAFAADDLILIWQVAGYASATSGNQGAIDLSSSTTVAHYEFARVASVALGTITLSAPLVSAFVGNSSQVVLVPEYTTVTVDVGQSIVAATWDGTSGGIVAFLARDTVTLNGTISAAAMGFRAGLATSNNGDSNCGGNDGQPPQYGAKGEGVQVPASAAVSGGMGNLANGGGGGNCHNAGGAGGGAYGVGGNGGGRWSDNADFGGRGGAPVRISLAQLAFGGGGGAGHVNQSTAPMGSGANGGGVVFIRAWSLTGAGTLNVAGGNAATNPEACDPAGGGGAGGTVHLRMNEDATCGGIVVTGGKGGDHDGSCAAFTTSAMGVGGGGAGGHVFLQSRTATCPASLAGGVPGTAAGNVSIRAQAGGLGTVGSVPPGGYFTPVVTAPAHLAATGSRRPTLSTRGRPNTTVFVLVDDVVACAGTSDGAGLFSCAPGADLSLGAHRVSARQSTTADIADAGPWAASHSFSVILPPVVTLNLAQAITVANASAYSIAGTCDVAASAVTVTAGTQNVVTACVAGAYAATIDVSAQPDAALFALAAVQTISGVPGTTAANVVKDTVAPDTAIVATPPATSATSAATFGVTGTDAAPSSGGLTFYCRLDAAVAFSLCPLGNPSTVALTGLGDGSHTLRIRSQDAVGNVDLTPAQYTWVIDTQVPAPPSITGPAANVVSQTKRPNIAGSSLVAEAGGMVRVFDGASEICATTVGMNGLWTCAALAADLAEGAHALTATVTDVAGNISAASAAVVYTVDTTPSANPVIEVPTDNAHLATQLPSVSGRVAGGATSVVVSEGVATLCTAVVGPSGAWSCGISVPLSVGGHTISAVASDAAGNTSGASPAVSFEVDIAPPAPPTFEAPAAASTTGPVIAFAGEGEIGATVRVQEGGNELCRGIVGVNGRWNCSPAMSLVDGVHAVSATAVDEAGNISGARPLQFTVDGTRPDSPTISAPTEGAFLPVALPTFSGTAEPLSRIEVREASLLLCGANVTAGGSWSCSPAVGLTEGTHTVAATAFDASNNASSPALRGFQVDTLVPPAPVVTAPLTGATVPSRPVFRGTGEALATVDVRADGNTVCTTVVASDGSWSCSPTTELAAGSRAIVVTQVDGAGNASPVASLGIIVNPNVPMSPVVNSPRGNAQLSDNTPTLTGTAGPGESITVSVDNVIVCTLTADVHGGWTCEVSTALPDGPRAVAVVATGLNGLASPPAELRIVIDTAAPPAPTVTSPLAALRPVFAGVAEPGNTVTVTADGNVACSGVAGVDGAWSCTATGDFSTAVPHNGSAKAVDEAGNESVVTTFSWAAVVEPDAGTETDGGSVPDGGAVGASDGGATGTSDGGVADGGGGDARDGGSTPVGQSYYRGGGCSCSTSASSAPFGALGLIVTLLAARRRRVDHSVG